MFNRYGRQPRRYVDDDDEHNRVHSPLYVFFNSLAGIIATGIVAMLLAAIVGTVYWKYYDVLADILHWAFIVLIVAGASLVVGMVGHYLTRPKAYYARGRRYPVLYHRGQYVKLDKSDEREIPDSVQVYQYQDRRPDASLLPTRDALPMIEAPTATQWPEAPSMDTTLGALQPIESDDKIILGYRLEQDETRPVFTPMGAFLAAFLGGNSGMGKTTATLGYLAQLAYKGVKLYVADGKGDIYNALAFCMPIARERAEYLALIGDVTALINARFRQSRPGVRFTPFVVVLEEWDMIRASCPTEASEFIELLINKGRSTGSHMLFTGQKLLADYIGKGNKGLIQTTILLHSRQEAGRLAGISSQDASAALLDAIAPPAPRGLAVVASPYADWQILALSNASPAYVSWALAYRASISGAPDDMGAIISLSQQDETPAPPILDPLPRKQERESVEAKLLRLHLAYPDLAPSALAAVAGNNNLAGLARVVIARYKAQEKGAD